MSPGVAALIIFTPIVLLNAWGLRVVLRLLRYRVPGWWRHGTATRPRAYRIGRPEPGPHEQRGPLTGRPCVAWRLSVVRRNPTLGTLDAVYDRYSDGEFWLDCEGERVPVLLLAGRHVRLRVQTFPYHAPPWVLPRIDPDRSFSLYVHAGVPALPPGHGLAPAQAQAAREVAVAEIAVHELPTTDGDTFMVSETLVDTTQEWVCEGPRSQDDPLAIIALPETDASFTSPNPVKLAPRSELMKFNAKTILLELSPLLLLDTIVLILILATIIQMHGL